MASNEIVLIELYWDEPVGWTWCVGNERCEDVKGTADLPYETTPDRLCQWIIDKAASLGIKLSPDDIREWWPAGEHYRWDAPELPAVQDNPVMTQHASLPDVPFIIAGHDVGIKLYKPFRDGFESIVLAFQMDCISRKLATHDEVIRELLTNEVRIYKRFPMLGR